MIAHTKRTPWSAGFFSVLFGVLCALPAFAEELEVPEDLQKRIDTALDKGARWLASRQSPDGSFPAWHHDQGSRWEGATALCTWTLLKCGVNGRHPNIDKAFTFMRDKWNARKEIGNAHQTYAVCHMICALEARYRPPEKKQKPPKRSSRQTEEMRRLEGADKVRLPPADLAWMQEMVDWLMTVRQKPAWRYPDGGMDLSATYFVVDALTAAQRCGVKFDVASLLSLLTWYLDRQAADGPIEKRYDPYQRSGKWEFYVTVGGDKARGFPYLPGDSAHSGSMTAAAIASLIRLKSLLTNVKEYTQELQLKTDQAIYDGLAWLVSHYTVERNPDRDLPWHYYYLYGLERVGVLFGSEFLGKYRWYLDGAEHLVQAQRPDGSWKSQNPDPHPEGDNQTFSDTCWALMFLKRGTLPVHVTITRPPELAITEGQKK